MGTITLARVTPYVRQCAMETELSDRARAVVRELMSTATGYAWGVADFGGPNVDSYTFGLVYGLYAARYATERTFSRPPIQDVFRRILAVRSDVASV